MLKTMLDQVLVEPDPEESYDIENPNIQGSSTGHESDEWDAQNRDKKPKGGRRNRWPEPHVLRSEGKPTLEPGKKTLRLSEEDLAQYREIYVEKIIQALRSGSLDAVKRILRKNLRSVLRLDRNEALTEAIGASFDGAPERLQVSNLFHATFMDSVIADFRLTEDESVRVVPFGGNLDNDRVNLCVFPNGRKKSGNDLHALVCFVVAQTTQQVSLNELIGEASVNPKLNPTVQLRVMKPEKHKPRNTIPAPNPKFEDLTPEGWRQIFARSPANTRAKKRKERNSRRRGEISYKGNAEAIMKELESKVGQQVTLVRKGEGIRGRLEKIGGRFSILRQDGSRLYSFERIKINLHLVASGVETLNYSA